MATVRIARVYIQTPAVPVPLPPSSVAFPSLLRGVLGVLVAAPLALAGTVAAQTINSPPKTVPLPPTDVEQVTALLKDKRLDEALGRLDSLLEKKPRDAQLRFLRGVVLSDLGRVAEAVPVFESLIQDFPELPEPYNNLAVLIAAQGRYEQARNLLHQSISAQPNYVTAYENLGDLYVAMAIDSYQRGARLMPGNAALQGKLKLARDFGTQMQTPR